MSESQQPMPVKGKKWKRIVRRVLLALGAVLLVAGVYLFLLLGEPDDDAKFMADRQYSRITSPMTSMEAADSAGLQSLADSFGLPVLQMYSGAVLTHARMNDVSIGSEYARTVTVTYEGEDGAVYTLYSIRPKQAASVIEKEGASLDGSALYTLAGLNACRMQTDAEITVFAENENALYALVCPRSEEGNLTRLLKQTVFITPGEF